MKAGILLAFTVGCLSYRPIFSSAKADSDAIAAKTPCSAAYPLPDGSSNPKSAAFSPNGNYLATADNYSGNVTMFRVKNGILSKGLSYPLPAGSDHPTSIAFSKNLVAVANSFKVYENRVTLFTVDPDGTLVNGTSYGLPLFGRCCAGVEAIAFSPQGEYLATVGGLADVGIFQVYSNGTLSSGTHYTLPEGTGYPRSIAFSPNGETLCAANIQSLQKPFPTGTVALFHVYSNGTLSDGTSYSLPSQSKKPVAVTFSPDGNYIATANFGSNDVSIVTLTNSTSYSLPLGSMQPDSVSFSPDGKHLITSDYSDDDMTLFVVNPDGTLADGTSYPPPPIDRSGFANSGALSPDGKFFATVIWSADVVNMYKLACYIKSLKEEGEARAKNSQALSTN